MKRLITTILALAFTLPCFAVDNPPSPQVQAEKVQVFVRPGKTPTTYNPYTGEVKEITPKVSGLRVKEGSKK